jgi:arabinoxylan arabinofuranohydrolase
MLLLRSPLFKPLERSMCFGLWAAEGRLLPIVLALAGMLVASRPASGVNPIVTDAYGADPSAHVFNGRMYVYGSHDRNDAKEFDMNDYHVYSSDDMQNWKDEGVDLSLKVVPWAEGHFWAPDCNVKEGTYYFYFPTRVPVGGPLRGRPVGVATSTNPGGPFTDPEPIPETENYSGIDPSVFVDDDGTAYFILAAHGCEIAKMTPDMKRLAGPLVPVVGTDRFFEGPWLFKRDKKYYMTYAASFPGRGPHGKRLPGQQFDYAIADKPVGPYQFMGAFTDSRGGNIHGSQVQWNGVWYCFYHDFSMSVGRLSHGFKRGIRCDVMNFNPDGSIQPLVWTDHGPKQLKWLDPFLRCEAECMCQTDLPEGEHAIASEACSEGGVDVTRIREGAWIRYAGVDFAGGAAAFTARVASNDGRGWIELHLDKRDGPRVGSVSVPDTGGAQKWSSVHCSVCNATGVHDLYITFAGHGGGELMNFDWYEFKSAALH